MLEVHDLFRFAKVIQFAWSYNFQVIIIMCVITDPTIDVTKLDQRRRRGSGDICN